MKGTLIQALVEVHDVLDVAGVPHALCGGLAANLYRDEVRATSDVDLAVAVGASQLVDLVETFTGIGWQAAPYWSNGEQLRLTRPDWPRVDCIVAATDYERTAIKRSVGTNVDGHELRVLTAEDLIVFKLVAGRARDYEAVVAIFGARGDRLDVDYIIGWLEQFGALAAWERVVKESHLEAGDR